MKLSIVPFAFRVENAAVAEDPKLQTGRPFAHIQALFVQPRLLPLLHHDVEIKSLQLNRPAIELVRDKQGIWNLPTIKKNGETDRGTGISLDQLKIYDG